MRIQIMGALAAIGDEKMAEKLLEIARDPKAEMRSDAVCALAEIGDERAIDLLIGLCLESEEGELYATIEVLREFGRKGLDALQQAFEKEKNFARKFKLKDIHHFLSKGQRSSRRR
jgi:HEAT repeat protein